MLATALNNNINTFGWATTGRFSYAYFYYYFGVPKYK